LAKKGKFVFLVNEGLTPNALLVWPQNTGVFCGAQHRRSRAHSAATTFSGRQSIET
jgi:hypothetical protein